MHDDCKDCQVRSACERKYNKLFKIIEKHIEDNLPKRSQAKDYKELQRIEAIRCRVKDKLKRANKLRKEAHTAKYQYTSELNKLLGLKGE